MWLCLPDFSLIGQGGCVGSDEPYVTIGLIVLVIGVILTIWISKSKSQSSTNVTKTEKV